MRIRRIPLKLGYNLVEDVSYRDGVRVIRSRDERCVDLVVVDSPDHEDYDSALREFIVLVTGEPYASDDWSHVGSQVLRDGECVLHVFDRTPDQ